LPNRAAVIGYYQTWRWAENPLTATQLDKLTHIILFQVYPSPDGSSLVTTWMNLSGTALSNFVDLAHSKKVKVIIGIGGSGGATSNFMNATNNTNRHEFVAALKKYIEDNNFDGADLDWETEVNWRQWVDLAIDLKAAMPSKWISGTLGADTPYSEYGNHFSQDASTVTYLQQNIWKIDAMQLMTYDMGGVWPTPADLEKSKQVLRNWASFGQGQTGFSKEKLFIGLQHQQDNATSIRGKISFAYREGYGGAILWETYPGNQTTFLDVAWDENNKNGGFTGNQVVDYDISVTYNNGGGTVKNGNNTVASGTPVSVQSGGSLTLTFAPNNGYEIGDVKINGTSNSTAKTSKTYKFDNVNDAQSIEVVFAKRHAVPGTFNSVEYSSKSPEITNNDDEHGKYVGGLVNNSALEYLISVPQNATYKISVKAAVQTAARKISVYDASVTTALGVLSVQKTDTWWNWTETETDITLSSGNKTLRLVANGVVNIENITISKEETPPPPPDAIAQNKIKTVSSVGASVINGNINMYLPSSVSSANIVLFDVRGKILFERSVAVNANFASVALPKSLLRNQAAILQVKTNSGFNMTKRILIK